jgi:hypothetical protein
MVTYLEVQAFKGLCSLQNITHTDHFNLAFFFERSPNKVGDLEVIFIPFVEAIHYLGKSQGHSNHL